MLGGEHTPDNANVQLPDAEFPIPAIDHDPPTIPEYLPGDPYADAVAERTRWWAYVEDVTRQAVQKDIAHRIGIDPSHISRWARGNVPSAPFVVEFARRTQTNVLRALAEAEIITDAEADLHIEHVGLSDYTVQELLEDALRRLGSDNQRRDNAE